MIIHSGLYLLLYQFLYWYVWEFLHYCLWCLYSPPQTNSIHFHLFQVLLSFPDGIFYSKINKLGNMYREFLEWRTPSSPALIKTCWRELAVPYPAYSLAQSWWFVCLAYYTVSVLVYFSSAITARVNWYTNLSSLCVSGLVRSFTSLFRILIFSNKQRWWNTHLNRRLFCMSYVKKKSYKSCKRRLCHRYPGVRIPASSTILRLVKKVRSTGSFLDKKYTT
jgi:hypothetical protein